MNTPVREPLEAGESGEGIWLRLHNEAGRAMILEMSDVPSDDYGDAALYYEVLWGEEVVVDARCHVCSVNKLSPGESLLFSVPREYLADGHTLRIRFRYEQEGVGVMFADREPKQYVYFRSAELPQKVLKKIK